MGTFITAAAVICISALAVLSLYKGRKKGNRACTGNCSACGNREQLTMKMLSLRHREHGGL